MAESQSQSTGEYEREPVPEHALLGFKNFVGMYAGEHCAGTELMIGPLFVAAGVSAFDVVVGLLLGNALAVLSWMVLTAPIAVRARLTLYYQLERICGRRLVTLYNLANGVMFCFLAGSMITVSATALGVMFDFPMPGLNDVYPNSVGWVLAVLAVGTAISVVAAYGYETVSRIANIAAPWMVLVFLAFGLVGLRQFMDATGTETRSLGDLWDLAQTTIWKGGEPLPGKVKFTFWHVTFFAWFCNMAMHVGMSDLSVFRFAKHSWYGLATAAGMYVGHFMAWLSAAVLYALQLHIDSTDIDVLPGPLAYKACGIAGLICVIIAGWTTANPTIYRAGACVSGHYAEQVAICGHAVHRRYCDAGGHVSGDRYAAFRVCCPLRIVADADGGHRLCRLLATQAAWPATEFCGAEWAAIQLGGWVDVVHHVGRLLRLGEVGDRDQWVPAISDLVCCIAWLVRGNSPLCRP